MSAIGTTLFLEQPSNTEYGNTLQTTKEFTLQKKLGGGGSKTAYQVSDSVALLLSNNLFEGMWERIVREDFAMSQFLQSVGLYGQRLEKVIYFDSDEARTKGENPLYALKAESFLSLRGRNFWVIDSKDRTYQVFPKKFFTTSEERKKAKNWLPLMGTIASDIAKIVHYRLPTHPDSFNFAYIPKDHSDLVSGKVVEARSFDLRYYGFDYTHKHKVIEIPTRTPFSQLSGWQYACCITNSYANRFFAYLPSPVYEYIHRDLLTKIDKILDNEVLPQIILNEVDPKAFYWGLDQTEWEQVGKSIKEKVRYVILEEVLDLQSKEYVSSSPCI